MKDDSRRFYEAPMLRIAIPAVAGIITASLISAPLSVYIIAVLLTGLGCALFWRTPSVSVYVWFLVFFFFAFLSAFQTPVNRIPYNTRAYFTGRVIETPVQRGRWQHTTVNIDSYRIPGGEWKRAEQKASVYLDTMIGATSGDLISFVAWNNPTDTTQSSYGKLMTRRGIHSRMYVPEYNLIRVVKSRGNNISSFSGRLQEALISRLERLDITGDDLAIVTAMTAGDKRTVSPDTRKTYNSVGAAHLLAVSGLHVGIVFVLINMVLIFLPLVRHGQMLRSIIGIILLWIYALAAGMSPSVIRAALMFSFVQVALNASSHRNALNVILGSAVVMLAVNPNYAGDPSFLLSYSAVIFIAIYFVPLYRLCRTRYGWLNGLISIFLIGIIATVGTAPLLGYWFGNLPLAGLIINVPVIITAHIIVMSGISWAVLPLDFLEPIFSFIAGGTAKAQNAMVAWSASLPGGSFSVSIPLGGVIILYIILLIPAVYLSSRHNGTMS